jgi:hypothetical protein
MFESRNKLSNDDKQSSWVKAKELSTSPMSEQSLSVLSKHDLEGDKSVFSLAVLFFRFQRFLHILLDGYEQ